jgi:hypothetical protein
MSDVIRFNAPIELQAALGDRKTPRCSMVAYTGGIMSPPGWPNVAIDLAGADVSGDIPLLAGHAQGLDDVVGQGVAVIRNGQIFVEGQLTEATTAGQKVLALARSGISLQASIGFVPERREIIPAGGSVAVNGRTIQAPAAGLTVVRSGKLREVSLLPIGADPNTTVSIAARCGLKNEGTPNMTFTEFLAARGYTDEAILTKEMKLALTATFEAENKPDDATRFARLEAVCRDHTGVFTQAGERAEALRTSAYRGQITASALESGLLMIEADMREVARIRSERPKAPAIHAATGDTGPDVLQAAFLCHLGQEGVAVKACGEQATEVARSMGLHSLNDIARAAILASGASIPSSRDGMIKAAFSTTNLPGILGNAANKISNEAYAAVPSVARVIAKRLSAKDFKDATGYRLTGDANFAEVGAAGEIEHGTLSESSFSYSLGTYARMFGITRKEFINDDLGKFAEIPALLGRGAATRLEQLFWTLVLANTGSFFSTGNANYIEGAGSALGIAGLTAGVTALRQLVDTNGDPINVTPKYLVVPPELEAVADQLYASANVAIAEASASSTATVPDGNPFKGKYQPMVTPYLSNANYPGYSANAWYLFGDPSLAAFGIAFLDGRESPTIEQKDADFNTLGVQYRGYHDFGVCQIDKCGGVKAKGTA